jgi:hypothetical protein
MCKPGGSSALFHEWDTTIKNGGHMTANFSPGFALVGKNRQFNRSVSLCPLQTA